MHFMTSKKVAGVETLQTSQSHSYQTVFNQEIAGFTSHTFDSAFSTLTTKFVSYSGQVIHEFTINKDKAKRGPLDKISPETATTKLREKADQCVPRPHNVENLSPAKDPRAPDVFHVTWDFIGNNAASSASIVLEVTRAWSPLGVDRFYQLVLDNYYDCAAFFRVVPDFVVQFGIAAQPNETEKWNTVIPDDPVTQSNLPGYVSFATAGPDTRTAQVFINTADNSQLDSQGFSPFAFVVSGIDAVYSMYNPTPGNTNGVPQEAYTLLGNPWILEKYPDITMIAATDGLDE